MEILVYLLMAACEYLDEANPYGVVISIRSVATCHLQLQLQLHLLRDARATLK